MTFKARSVGTVHAAPLAADCGPAIWLLRFLVGDCQSDSDRWVTFNWVMVLGGARLPEGDSSCT